MQKLSVLFIFIFLVSFAKAWAQTPVGLFEGLLGNSGAALTDSSAPSYYNPSLLILKDQKSRSISGNTFSSFGSTNSNEKTSSISFYPTYLSSIFMSESLAHEIFVINLTPTRLQTLRSVEEATFRENYEATQDKNVINGGYSMAFKSFPLALSFFAQFTQIKEFGFKDFTSLNSDLRNNSVNRGELSRLSSGFSVSGHTRFENYTFGYNLKMRPLVLLSYNKLKTTSYIRGESAPTDYRVSESESSVGFADEDQNSMLLGHSFRAGEHEFITDTILTEKTVENHDYKISQSFGYRLSDNSGHQFLTGLSHRLDRDIKYLGQDLYVSVGYSWNNRANRTTFGLYYYRSDLINKVSAAGITFGSEFNY
jgi:hypothetical protein